MPREQVGTSPRQLSQSSTTRLEKRRGEREGCVLGSGGFEPPQRVVWFRPSGWTKDSWLRSKIRESNRVTGFCHEDKYKGVIKQLQLHRARSRYKNINK